jgi:hypothetical protein
MNGMADQATLAQRGERLYDLYAKPLEAEHAGKFIAIAPDGRVMVGDTMREVAIGATEAFGRGNFLFRIGPRSVGRWR